MRKNDSKKADNLISAAALLISLAFIAVYTLINFKGFSEFIDGDIYSDMLLSKLMWEQKTLFPDNWLFGNQVYVIATPVVAALFYGLTGSINLSMPLATTLMGTLTILSLLWLLRPFVKRRASLFLAPALLFGSCVVRNLAYSRESQLFFVMGSYYACYIITMFLCFGDFLRALFTPERGRRIPMLIVCLLLCYCTGIQSIRQTLIMIAPLAVFCVFALICSRLYKKQVSKALKSACLRTLLYVAANISGLVSFRFLDIAQNTIYGSVSLDTTRPLSQRLLDIWHAVRDISGVSTALMNGSSVLCFVFVPIICLSIPAAMLLIIKRRKSFGALEALWLLTALSIAAVFSVSLFFEINLRSIYIFMFFPLVAFSGVYLYEKLDGCGRYISSALLCSAAAFSLICGGRECVYTSLKTDTEQPALFYEFCRENDIRYIYGEWSTLPKLLYAVDGAVTPGFWNNDFELLPYLNIRGIYSDELLPYSVFAFGDHNLYLYEKLVSDYGAETEYLGYFFNTYIYRSSVQPIKETSR